MRSNLNRALPLLLVLLLFRIPSVAAPDAVQASISQWKPGRRMELVLTSGQTVTGRLVGLRPDGFTLHPDQRGAADRELRFDEVRSVKAKMTTARKWAVAGIIYGVLTVMGLILGK